MNDPHVKALRAKYKRNTDTYVIYDPVPSKYWSPRDGRLVDDDHPVAFLSNGAAARLLQQLIDSGKVSDSSELIHVDNP